MGILSSPCIHALAAALAIGGCSVAKHAPPDAGVPDAGDGRLRFEPKPGGDPLLHCPTIAACEPAPAPAADDPDAFVLRTSDVGEDVHFVALKGNLVLAERGERGEPIAVLVQPEPPLAFTIATFPTELEQPKLIDVGSYGHFYSLVCDSRRCEIFEGLDPPERVASIDGGKDTVVGIVAGCFQREHDDYAFCLFGDGLSCFDGSTWTTEIEPASGQRILAAAFDYRSVGCPLRLASGAHGALWRRDERWHAIATKTTADLTTIALHLGRFTVASENGVIEGDPLGVIECDVNGLALRRLARTESYYACTRPAWNGERLIDNDATARGFGSAMFGFTALGQLIYKVRPVDQDCNGPERWECYDEPGPSIDLASVHCGAASNLWQLTRDALTGSLSCPPDLGE